MKNETDRNENQQTGVRAAPDHKTFGLTVMSDGHDNLNLYTYRLVIF